jgi:nucleotide-binding universal stress UspA family protein
MEIIDFAKESGADLIVMCTHGRSGITRWVLGSVTLKVLTRAETPILLLRSKD